MEAYGDGSSSMPQLFQSSSIEDVRKEAEDKNNRIYTKSDVGDDVSESGDMNIKLGTVGSQLTINEGLLDSNSRASINVTKK